MTKLPELRLAKLAGAAGLACAWVMPAGVATAAEPVVPEMTYSCIADASLAAANTKVTFAALGLPEKVSAGETLSLQGTLGISVPDGYTLLSKIQGAKQINVESSTFNLQVAVDGKSSSLTADEAVGSPVKFASPTTVTAGVTFPSLTIPADADGELVISLPTEANVKHSVTNAPAKVAFTTVLNQDSLLAPERQLDCSAPKDAARVVVAKIQITPAPSATPSATPTPTATPMPEVAVPEQPQVPLPLDPGGVTAPPLAEAPVTQEPVLTNAAPQLEPTNAPIPPRTTGRGTFIPAWSLVMSGALVPAGLVLFAANQRKQLRQLMNEHRFQEEGTSR